MPVPVGDICIELLFRIPVFVVTVRINTTHCINIINNFILKVLVEGKKYALSLADDGEQS